MTPPKKELTDSGEQRAIQFAEAVAERLDERSPSASAETLILQHEKECREAGPIKELRAEVAILKGWAKVAAVALALTPLWLALTGYALSGYIVSRFQELRPAHTSGLFVPSAAAQTKGAP